jgi:uncharacterized RDD family membrane protein YckC
MEQIVVQPPPMHPAGAEYAGFWKRFWAYFIDKLILSAFGFILVLPFVAVIGLGSLANRDFDSSSSEGLVLGLVGACIALGIFLFIADWLYFSLMESKKGATLGKMAMKLKVTDMNGQPVSFGRASGRYFGKILSALILYVGFMMAGWTQQKQALHDILSGCLVVTRT